jgi:hypothetical protein
VLQIRWSHESAHLEVHIADSATTGCLVHRPYGLGIFLLA